MKSLIRFTAAACIFAAAATAHAKIERVVEKSFPVQPGGTLHVATQGGDVRVAVSADPVVKVVATEKIKANSEAAADEILKKLKLTMELRGNDVVATAEYDGEHGLHWGSWPPVEVSFLVTVPSRYSAELRTSGGNITSADLDGTLRARTSGGDVKLGKISGEVEAASSGGDVSLAGGGAGVKLSTSGGDIRLDHATGPTELKTSGGNISAGTVEGALTARTSGGDVTAAFASTLKGDCALSTSGGQVKVTVAPGAGFRLDAATSGGEVDAEGLTITIEHGGRGHSRLAGAVNGGGPVLRLRSSGGDIVVRTATAVAP